LLHGGSITPERQAILLKCGGVFAVMARSGREKSQNPVWGFFSSVRLTFALLIILAISSILGTIIPQQEAALDFARQLSPGVFRILRSLDLFDMYHSIWFRLLMGFLSLNLIICSINRFPNTLKKYRAVPKPDRGKPFEDLPLRQTFLTRGDLKETSDAVATLLRSRYKNVHSMETSETSYFYGEKGRFSNFGVYLVHMSVLLILLGALAGSFFGFEAYVNILEGGRIDTVTLRRGMTPIKLGFEVGCDKFTVDFYESGVPKEYRSDLRFFIDGKEEKKAVLLVNHPSEFKGITFYQSSYGTVSGDKVHLRISGPRIGSRDSSMDVEKGKLIELPAKEGKFSIKDVRDDIMGLGPAVLVSVQPGTGKEIEFWVFKDQKMARKRLPGPMAQSPKFDPAAFKPYTFFLDGTETKYYTGLQVNKDPGVPIVWLGCFVMVFGFFITFFTYHRRTWIRVSREGDGIRITVAGTASKNPVGLRRHLERLTRKLRDLFDGRE
jgi:cytochrome c biogenesis protein